MNFTNFFIKIGPYLVGICAAILSWNSLKGLFNFVGFIGWQSYIGPICIDMYALVSAQVWMVHNIEKGNVYIKKWAKWNAIFAIVLSITGNIIYHTIVSPTKYWLIVGVVAAIPPLVFGLVVHLRSLLINYDKSNSSIKVIENKKKYIKQKLVKEKPNVTSDININSDASNTFDHIVKDYFVNQ